MEKIRNASPSDPATPRKINQLNLEKPLDSCYPENLEANRLEKTHLERVKKMETMKNEAQTFLSERTNITPKAGTSLVNRAVSVLGKEHSTTRGAISGLISSWSALANDEKTSEPDSLEIWYLADALRVFILPLCDAIDASVKAKQASKADTSKPAKLANGKREAWADSQEEAQALRAQLEPAPAKPARGRKAEAPAPALDLDSVARLLATILEGRA